jgi:hypothetical protein
LPRRRDQNELDATPNDDGAGMQVVQSKFEAFDVEGGSEMEVVENASADHGDAGAHVGAELSTIEPDVKLRLRRGSDRITASNWT